MMRDLTSFDITTHEWADCGIGLVVIDSDGDIEFRAYDDSGFYLSKQDAIAIAKHFRLTQEDLKGE